MKQLFGLLALLCLGATAPAAHVPADTFLEFRPAEGMQTIEAQGLTVRIEARKCGDRRAISEACWKDSSYFVATVSAPGMVPLAVEGEAGVGAFFGIGKLGASATRPSFILMSLDGGSASCAVIDIATPQGTAYRAVRLRVPASPREEDTFCGTPGYPQWPRDMTGHGRAEFLMVDTAFYCRFGSCASTVYPPRVIAFDGRLGRDVSTDPALAPLYRAAMAKARFGCAHDEMEAQAACAAYAADASRLGMLDQARRVIDAQVRRGCRIPTKGKCYYGNSIAPDFPAKLAAMLARAGYR